MTIDVDSPMWKRHISGITINKSHFSLHLSKALSFVLRTNNSGRSSGPFYASNELPNKSNVGELVIKTIRDVHVVMRKRFPIPTVGNALYLISHDSLRDFGPTVEIHPTHGK